MAKLRVGLVFGGVSAEHEISIITFDQVHRNINREKYDPVPIYITQEGDWICDDRLRDVTRYGEIFTGKKSDLARFNRKILPPYPIRHETGGWARRLFGNKIEIDVAFPLIHGTNGEDGSLQGLFELADIPYVGSGVTGSALGMDKVVQKQILKSAGVPVVKFRHYLKAQIEADHEGVRKDVMDNLRFPVFVKPACSGSSVGVSRAESPEFLAVALDEACRYDRKVIVEEGVPSPREINCAVMGDDTGLTPSVCEEVFSEGFLDYRQKYLKGATKGKGAGDGGLAGGGMANASRRIPAEIDEKTAGRVRELAKSVFRALDCSGCARVDFLLDREGNLTVTELNSIPGSLSFYLWEASGVPFPELLDRLIALALAAYRNKKMLRRTSGFGAVKSYIARAGE